MYLREIRNRKCERDVKKIGKRNPIEVPKEEK